jgi:acetylglutamate kinase
MVFMSYVGMKPVIVHGGGPFINKKMKNKGKIPEFIEGHRVTDEETMKIVDETLSDLNEEIVNQIKSLRKEASGISGKDSDLINLKKQSKVAKEKLGFVGEIESVNTEKITDLLNKDKIPVICPLAKDAEGNLYNVNADRVSCEIATSLNAEKLVLLTDIKGILKDEKDEESLIPTLNTEEAKELIKKKVITKGMVPKVKACIEALLAGVRKTHIIDGRIPHSLLLEIFTDKGIGSEIVKS